MFVTCVPRHNLHARGYDNPLLDWSVCLSVCDSKLANLVYKSCEILLEGKSFMVDLIELDMVDFDVILGMDWLASCHATLDCQNKVKYDMLREPTIVF